MRIHLALLAIALLAACSNDTPNEKLAKDIAPASSWVATLQFAAENWLSNRVPSSFVRETAKAAGKAFDKARQTVHQSKADAKLRDDVEEQLRDAANASDVLRNAVQRGDRKAVASTTQRFAAAHEVLHHIEDQYQQ